MIDLIAKKRTEEQDYITLHLVPVDTECVSGELFYKVDLNSDIKVGDIIAVQNQEVEELKQLVADLTELVLPIEETEGGIL